MSINCGELQGKGGKRMRKIITFGTLKGGTGKSTTVFSTAGILAERGYRVLIVDVDPQANITSNLGIDETLEGYIGIKELFEDERINPEKAIIKGPIRELPTLDIIGASMGLTSTEMRIISYPGREYLLKKYFRKYNSTFNRYDYIIFDTNPSMSIINQNSFVVSDAIVIVSDIGINSLKGLELFVALWEDIVDRLDIDNNIKGLLINKYNSKSSISREFVEYCHEEDDIRRLLFHSFIPADERISECELSRKPVNLIYKNNEICDKYNSFVDELISRV